MNTRQLGTAVVALLILASVLTAGVAFATSQPGDSGDASEYTIEELKQDGTHYSQPSARIVPSESQVYWLEHRPTNKPWKTVSKRGGGVKLAEDGTLKTNTLYLRTILASAEPQTRNVTIVYWQQETRQVTTGNSTTTETYAANKKVVHKTLTLEPGWSLAEIELPQHGEVTRVTMWLDEHPEEARWTFKHHSVAIQQTIPINSYTGFVLYGAAFIMIPALGTHWYGSRKVKQWIDKAGAPPGHGFAYYFIVMALLLAIIAYAFYYELSEVIVAAPPVLGIWVGLVSTGHTLASHEGRTTTKMVFQPHIDSDGGAFSSVDIPSYGSGTDDKTIEFSEKMKIAQWATYRFLEEGQKGLSIVRDGKLAFLARLKGGRARIQNASELKTRLSTPESPSDEMIVVHQDADSLIDYKPPRLALKTPDIDTWRDAIWPGIATIGAGLLAWQTAQAYGPLGWTALLVAAPLLVWKFAVTGTDSHVRVEPAAIATRHVLATQLVGHIGLEHAADLEAAEEFAFKTISKSGEERREQFRRYVESELDGTWSDINDGELADGSDSSTDGDVSPVDSIDSIDTPADPADEEEVSGDD